ncbi:hypothetical protein pkur_cds_474 [Pandoravirus kuranda]|uniref:Ankyrin repeat domain containing protein n=1 Tax=Pandoravirus kuranda TaxID=3019033 RepID=A0AA95EEQ6_9VIRU|nr:hypothetical protein pkur_cds_474 [Pandoravirus kuranda]
MSQPAGNSTTRWQRRKRRRLAKKKKGAEVEPTSVAVVGLATMPREILDKITDSIESVRDMGAWSIATGLPTQARHPEAVKTENIPTENVIAAGAPLPVVEALLSCHQHITSTALVTAAALGGRLDVYRWLSGKNAAVASGCIPDAVGAILPTLIRRGLLDITDDIVTKCSPRTPAGRISLLYHHRVEALKEALRGSHAALARKLHDHADHHEWGSCVCHESVLPWIFGSDLPDALATLRRIGCRRAKRECRLMFTRAVETGAVAIASQIAERRSASSTPLAPPMGSVLTAASRGHGAIIAWLYKERHYDMPAEVLGTAARAGHLNILKWAARACGGKPIASWNARYVAYAATEGCHPEPIIHWLLARPADRRDLSAGVAKAALVRHGYPIPLLLHKSGIAAFDTWNALEIAVEKASVHSAYVVVSNGGRCDTAALTRCLMCHGSDMIALLARYYTPDDMQTVLNSGLVGMCSWEPVAWLVDNVPDLCVRDARDIFMASLSMGPYPDPCACSMCRRPRAHKRE